jgi:hypothetical protein
MLVRRVLEQCRQEHEKKGKGSVYAAVHPLLTNEPEPGAYEHLAAHLSMETGTVKVTLHRMRKRFGELLRREVAHTVAHPEDVEPELRELLAAIAS